MPISSPVGSSTSCSLHQSSSSHALPFIYRFVRLSTTSLVRSSPCLSLQLSIPSPVFRFIRLCADTHTCLSLHMPVRSFLHPIPCTFIPLSVPSALDLFFPRSLRLSQPSFARTYTCPSRHLSLSSPVGQFSGHSFQLSVRQPIHSITCLSPIHPFTSRLTSCTVFYLSVRGFLVPPSIHASNYLVLHLPVFLVVRPLLRLLLLFF